jgi:hypothetical protein
VGQLESYSICGESNNLSEMGAEFGLVCCCFLLPFAPTLDKGLIQNPGRSRRPNLANLKLCYREPVLDLDALPPPPCIKMTVSASHFLILQIDYMVAKYLFGSHMEKTYLLSQRAEFSSQYRFITAD